MGWARPWELVGVLLLLLVGVQVGVHVAYHIDAVHLRSLRVVRRPVPSHHPSASAGWLEGAGLGADQPASGQQGPEAQDDYTHNDDSRAAERGHGMEAGSEQGAGEGSSSEIELAGDVVLDEESGVEREGGGDGVGGEGQRGSQAGGAGQSGAGRASEGGGGGTMKGARARAKADHERGKKHHLTVRSANPFACVI
jgi:hypothetical protein